MAFVVVICLIEIRILHAYALGPYRHPRGVLTGVPVSKEQWFFD
ncbi:MAG: hypothetical protein V5789_05700 [Colwellia sp.]